MLRSRIIPSLLFQKNGLVKTKQFSFSKYLGDPLNTVKIFNEKNVDEIIFSDIEATVNNQEPNYIQIEKIANMCRMPICYAGGIKNIFQIEKIISYGVEKVGISSAAIEQPNLIREAAKIFGSQSIVVIFDVKKIYKDYHVFTYNGTLQCDREFHWLLDQYQDLGAGEIFINAIDRDGTREGYDTRMIEEVFPKINVPLTVCGGAGNFDDLKNLFKSFNIIGGAAGSLFVLSGKYHAVLIQYPDETQRKNIFDER